MPGSLNTQSAEYPPEGQQIPAVKAIKADKAFSSFRTFPFAAGIVLLIAFILASSSCTARRTNWTPLNALLPAHSRVEIADSGETETLLAALDQSIEYYQAIPADHPLQFGAETVNAANLLSSLMTLSHQVKAHGVGPELFKYLDRNFATLESADSSVLFTGYFEAQLNGSRNRTQRYRYPLYRKPSNMVRIHLSDFHKTASQDLTLIGRVTQDGRVLPYYSRKEIDYQNALADKDLEIVWVDDLLDLFFLHIQGSGIIALEDGSTIQVSPSGRNGHPYRSIGRKLVEQGTMKLEDVSMQSIKAYLRDHPEEVETILNYNPSYVFFYERESGALGSLGRQVTPFRTIATDSKLFPKGALAFIETDIPHFDDQGNIAGFQRDRRLVFNQDTGGAIKGPGRVDLFTGVGNQSELVAGHLKSTGKLYFLLPRKHRTSEGGSKKL